MGIPSFVHLLSFYGHLDCFYFGAIVKKAATNTNAQLLYGHVFISGRCMLRRGIAGSYGKFMVNFLRNLQGVFPSSCAI